VKGLNENVRLAKRPERWEGGIRGWRRRKGEMSDQGRLKEGIYYGEKKEDGRLEKS
jgi:hypothetical protein